MDETPRVAPAGPSLGLWLATTAIPLGVLLAGQWWIDRLVLHLDRSLLTITTFLTFLAVYPLCYVFGLSMAAKRGAAVALINGLVGFCAMTVVAVLLSLAVIVLGVLTLGLMAIVGIPLAGAAYGLALDQLQRTLLGYPAGSRQAWRHLHWIYGAVASIAPLAIVLTSLFGRIPSAPTPPIEPAAVLYVVAALPHLLSARAQLGKDAGLELAATTPWVTTAVRGISVAVAVPLLVYYGLVKLTQYEERPPIIAAGLFVEAPIADRVYVIPGTWIEHHVWERHSRRFGSLTLNRAFDDDARVAVAPPGSGGGIRIDGYLHDSGTEAVSLPCRDRAFGALSACWHPTTDRYGNDPLWAPPDRPDFTVTLTLPRIYGTDAGILLLDDLGRQQGQVLPATPDPAADGRRYRLILRDGEARWTVALTERQMAALDRIVDALRGLQAELAAGRRDGS